MPQEKNTGLVALLYYDYSSLSHPTKGVLFCAGRINSPMNLKTFTSKIRIICPNIQLNVLYPGDLHSSYSHLQAKKCPTVIR
jgi:hypothetical protein